MMVRERELVIIGGGAAGLSAAVRAREQGIRDILVIERSARLGGILRQCIHNGFGIHRYGEDLTGVEFAERAAGEVVRAGIDCMLETFAIGMTRDKVITVVNPAQGRVEIRAGAVILAMGCRERSRGALMIPGRRLAGVITAGTAQRYLNLDGYLPGKRVVILGSGDIGLIMARQFVLEGAKVEHVVEIMPCSSGLARNIAQCIEDFSIPISYNSTVAAIHGRGRVEYVTVVKVDENRLPIPGSEFTIPCDTLLISAGLIPENELTKAAGIVLSAATKGAVVDDTLMTSQEGVFSCGNVLHVHDLVDFVSLEGARAGENAAHYLKKAGLKSKEKGSTESAEKDWIAVEEGFGVNAAVPQKLCRDGNTVVEMMFRPRGRYFNCTVCVDADGVCVKRIKKRVLTQGEMCSFALERRLFAQAEKVVIRLEV